MRIAVVSDIHANLSALDAVIADLRLMAPDLVVHGGDLVGGGARPADVIDRIREMNWPGVYGNTDEMLWAPHRVSETLQASHLRAIGDLLLTHTITDNARGHRCGTTCVATGLAAAVVGPRSDGRSRGTGRYVADRACDRGG
jgi:predicted phosphodiesterase